MKAEALNKVLIGKTPKQIKKILYLYNKPFIFEELENHEWYPSSEYDREYLGDDDYNRLVRAYQERDDKLYFKNLSLSWDSCECEGWCSCKSWVYEIKIRKPDYIRNNIINKIQNINTDSYYDKKKIDYWVFELEEINEYSIDYKVIDERKYASIPLPKTLGDFIYDCERVGVELEWSDLISKLYFEEEINVTQLNLF